MLRFDAKIDGWVEVTSHGRSPVRINTKHVMSDIPAGSVENAHAFVLGWLSARLGKYPYFDTYSEIDFHHVTIDVTQLPQGPA